MLWTPWPTYVPSVLFVCALLAWWFVEPKTAHLNLIVVVGCVLFYWAVAPELAQATPYQIYQFAICAVKALRLDVLVQYHANMLVTGLAIVWLAHRAVQTLRKSVNELIGVLGVEVPDAPKVSLAGIRSDAATLNWTPPEGARPVAKFTIQVNGVNVGDSANQETAITVTGLKPNHFYNIRVIAVGYNNFQAPSRVVRLRTYARDGRPQLGDGRLPASFVPEQQHLAMPSDHADEEGGSRSPAAGVEAASVAEPSGLTAQASSGALSGTRRNTLTRKHSPSTASMDPPARDVLDKDSEGSLQELGERFESIRREIDETQSQIAKDEKEHKELMDELAEEKKIKKRMLKEKDDTTEKLKREAGTTERAMRSAQQRKTQKEKLLREKRAERQKLHDEIAKWDKDIASMAKRQNGFEKDRNACQREGDLRAEELRAEIAQTQASLAQEEVELREKSRELKEAEEQRKKLPGGEESEERRETDRQIRRDWEVRAKELQRHLFAANKKLRMVNDYGNVLQTQLTAAQQSGLPFMYNQANSSGVEFDLSSQNQLKRRSRNSNSLSNVVIPSPIQSFSILDRPYGPSTFGPSRPPTIPPGFAPGPYMEHKSDFAANHLDDDLMRHPATGAPLSPTAAALLPAGMLDDFIGDEPPSPNSRRPRHNTFGSAFSHDNDPQSPASSARSLSIFSSPQGSSQHLPFSQYTGENSERRSLKGIRGDLGTSSPIPPPSQAVNINRRSFLPWLHRGPKAPDEPPALGTLKPGQTQSLPRPSEDLEAMPSKRRISFSTGWNMFNRNSVGPEISVIGSPDASRILPHQPGLVANPNSLGGNVFPERGPSSPRPVSIASSEFTRPSTESGSIWNRIPQPNRLWAADDNPWAPSRNPSRRQSIHGSPSALKTTLADADDEILDDAELLHASPSQVGVIGTKPLSKTLSQRLNPTAPSFMAGLFRAKPDREKETERESREPKDKASKMKAKEMELAKERPRVSLSSVSEVVTPPPDDSPSDSRKSRDAFSIGTPSVTESRESLTLDQAPSNTPSEHAAAGLGLKEQESGLRKLLRKGSSSKFSFTSVRGLGGKKGPSSVANSDKNASAERSSFDEYAEEGGGTITNVAPGRSFESFHSSPSLGPSSTAGRHPKDKAVSWGSRFAIKKKPGKEKDSLDIEREDLAADIPSPAER
ncbi:hypothetical protein GGS23DRAFT_562332 [Durotheca rogersii]|uniref:uncharacterized protein n=1 Tax=Durotheca rogersii TaxID=419775 RepID=UPI0022200876|nr:uncharacterized protein GGS23DRAFT_562332 [Durotheca rogersii]KAI5864910.1 hypothetical protein GGS23DRAFT_562332 [Durotheca rogersii]